MIATKAYAAFSAVDPLGHWEFFRRDLKDDDILIEILYCGVCHSDLHHARSEWGAARYPVVPGHEIVGKVLKIGRSVSNFSTGDTVGVGVIVDSCSHCRACKSDFEQYCEEGATLTYGSMERDGSGLTQGGYSTHIETKEKFVLRIHPGLTLSAVAPLLCAGITTYSPLRYAGVKHGSKVGVIGLGGLGHMGVKFASSFGAEVSVISTSPDKEADAKRLGASHFILSEDSRALKRFKSYFDVILDTVSANHDYSPYLDLLGFEGKLMVVGLPVKTPATSPFALITNRRSITGSMIGSMKETQEMLDYCAEKSILSDVEIIPIQYINTAWDRMVRQDVKYRFVVDMNSLR